MAFKRLRQTNGGPHDRLQQPDPQSGFWGPCRPSVRRINLFKDPSRAARFGGAVRFSQPVYGAAVLNRAEVIPEIQNKVAQQYLYAVAWQTDNEAIQKEITVCRHGSSICFLCRE